MTKTLVICGGSRGIGLSTAELFAARGYRVVNLSRSPCPVAGVVQVTADIESVDWTEAVQAKLLDATEGSGRLCLVHGAGLLAKDNVFDLDVQSFHRVLQVNVVAAQQLNRLLLTRMGEGSSILYVGSTLGERAVANSMSYVVSKHALIGLMRATCQDLAGKGIHTACVCPGFTDTDMLRAHLGGEQAVALRIASTVTMGRLIEPAEIADVLWFCAASPVINGAVLHANLGQIEH